MLVDDERDIVFVLKTGLSRNGFDVDAFSNPRHALSYFEPGAYDLLILDVRMPGMSGIELYREIQKKEPGIKVVFLTAFEIDDQEWEMMLPDFNINNIIRKPVTVPDLVQRISRMAG